MLAHTRIHLVCTTICAFAGQWRGDSVGFWWSSGKDTVALCCKPKNRSQPFPVQFHIRAKLDRVNCADSAFIKCRTDEELMRNWWGTDEELMKNWWRTDEELKNGEKGWKTMKNSRKTVKNGEKTVKNQWKAIKKQWKTWSGLVWSGLVMRTWYILAAMPKIYIYWHKCSCHACARTDTQTHMWK